MSCIMQINIDQWCVTSGFFYGKVYAVIPNNKNSYDGSITVLIFLYLFCSAFVFLIFLKNSDIESNPDRKLKLKSQYFFMLPSECQ